MTKIKWLIYNLSRILLVVLFFIFAISSPISFFIIGSASHNPGSLFELVISVCVSLFLGINLFVTPKSNKWLTYTVLFLLLVCLFFVFKSFVTEIESNTNSNFIIVSSILATLLIIVFSGIIVKFKSFKMS